MENPPRTSNCRPVAVFLFITCLFLLNWPLLSMVTDRGVLTVASLFLLWLGIIFCLWMYCRNEAKNSPGSDNEDRHR